MASGDVLLSPLSVAPAYAAVVARLRRSIALGLVLPGERLPSERALAESFGVSRVTVREALRVLQGEGLIVTKRGGGGGAVITSRDVSIEQIRNDFRRRGAQIEQVFEFRLALETMSARLAAERRTEADLRRLTEGHAGLLASDAVGEFRRADSTFHLAVADASENPMLRESIEDARAAMFDSFDVLPFEVLRDSTATGHAAVLQAIEDRRADAAAAAMAEHLRQARSEVLTVLSRDG